MKIIGLGEVLARYSNRSGINIMNISDFDIYYGGSEFNTLCYLSNFNHKTSIITKLPDNFIGKMCMRNIKSKGISDENIILSGEKLGIYYTKMATKMTSTKVLYDREKSALTNINLNEKELENILQNYDHFHVSGITAALNSKLSDLVLNALKIAKKLGLSTSFDSNYRKKLWDEKTAGEFLAKSLPYIDYAFLGILDLEYLLKYDITNEEKAFEKLMKEYSNLKLIAFTKREIITPLNHNIQGFLYSDKLIKTNNLNVEIIDRIGTGDAFCAGVLEGVFSDYKEEKILDFAIRLAQYKHYINGDNCDIEKEEILNCEFKINR